MFKLEIQVVDGASARPVREEEEDSQQDCGGEERCHRPHDDGAAVHDRVHQGSSSRRMFLKQCEAWDACVSSRPIPAGGGKPTTTYSEIYLAILEDVVQRCRRVFGNSHPMTVGSQGALEGARERLSNNS